MKKMALAALATLFMCACSKDEKPTPKPDDLDPRGVFHPLDNETDPDKISNWFTKGPTQYVEGADVERAYAQLPLSKIMPEIVVAVIDGGIDINHEDLKGKIWTNFSEAQGQPGVDDDGNGYIDDIHGWNFLGNINHERFESVRELARLRKLTNLTVNDQAYLNKLDSQIAGDRTVIRFQIQFTLATLARLKEYFEAIQDKFNITFENLTIEDIEKFNPSNSDQEFAKQNILNELTATSAKSILRLQMRLAGFKYILETSLNENFNPRAEILKDDPDNFSSSQYGNNDVIGPDPLHGTHVAGIIAANRNNGLGIDGISTSAKIMAIRAIPNGDEYDKDVYFAVKYAVDNGAKIINMSFGKKLSPHKSKLDEIFKYAASRGVLLVHAAGNAAQNNDQGRIFPTRSMDSPNSDSEIKNWIEVGASSRYNTSALAGIFSNYGKKTVDIFAPGVEINSTAPGNNYITLTGTSMATPAVTGVLSLLLAQNPNLSAQQAKQLILKNGRDKSSLKVAKPGIGELIPFKDLSRTGMILDGYKSLEKLLR